MRIARSRARAVHLRPKRARLLKNKSKFGHGRANGNIPAVFFNPNSSRDWLEICHVPPIIAISLPAAKRILHKEALAMAKRNPFFGKTFDLVKQTFAEWL